MSRKNRLKELMKNINKKAGEQVAYNLKEETTPTQVQKWIPTGSRYLDSIICKGQMAGIPCGKISELAGLPSCVSEETIIEVIIED